VLGQNSFGGVRWGSRVFLNNELKRAAWRNFVGPKRLMGSVISDWRKKLRKVTCITECLQKEGGEFYSKRVQKIRNLEKIFLTQEKGREGLDAIWDSERKVQ